MQIERVPVLLGHQSVRITERHSAPWVRARQEQLEQDILEARVGIEPSSPLQTRKLFIPRSDKNYKNDGNAEVGYTAGTRDTLLATLRELGMSGLATTHPSENCHGLSSR